MNDLPFILWYLLLGVLAFVVLPVGYVWLLRRMRRERIWCPPRIELFVGFGTIGGWVLLVAVAGSGPLIMLPVMAFQVFIAIPSSLICVYRLGLGAPRSNYHLAARWFLACGVMFPLSIYVVGYFLGM